MEQGLEVESGLILARNSNFKRSLSEFSVAGGKRGRKILPHWQVNIFLLAKSNQELVPSLQEALELTRYGLGSPKNERPCAVAQTWKKSKVSRHWNKQELDAFICSSYPTIPLIQIGFWYAKSDRGRRLIRLSAEITKTTSFIECDINKGKLYIIPYQNIPLVTTVGDDLNLEISASWSEAGWFQDDCNTESGGHSIQQNSDDDQSLQDSPHQSSEKNLFYGALNSLLQDYETIHICRENLFDSMLSLYSSNGICFKRMSVVFKSEKVGEEQATLQDLFSLFWLEAYQKYFTGEELCIPYLPLHQLHEAVCIFTSLGRIFSHGLALTGVIPLRFCRSTFITIFLGSQFLSEEVILSDFMKFVTPSEREIFQTCWRLNSFTSFQIEELLQIFSRFELRQQPKACIFKQQILNIAKMELIVKPFYFINLIKEGIPKTTWEQFWSKIVLEELYKLFSDLTPTPKSIALLLEAKGDNEILLQDEERVFYFLKDFIKGLNTELLDRFLIFVTGAFILPQRPIQVIFHRDFSFARAPKSHICANILSLPTSYNTIQEFKTEFTNVLMNKEAFFTYNLL